MATSEQQNSQQQTKESVEWFKYSRRAVLRSIVGRADHGLGLVGERIVVGGWVKAFKEHSKHEAAPAIVQDFTCSELLMSRMPLLRCVAKLFARGGDADRAEKAHVGAEKVVPMTVYLRINDGSCVANLQVIVDSSMSLVAQVMSIGTCILVKGVLERPTQPTKHVVQLKVDKILHVGVVDTKKYPLAKPKLTLDSIRSYPHLRPRTITIASVTRIRNGLSYATHKFFQDNGFLYVHMPIIKTVDMNSFSKTFNETTLLGKSDDIENSERQNNQDAITLETVKSAIKEKSNRIEELKRSDSNRETLLAALRDLQKANELALHIERQQRSTTMKIGAMDALEDFFSFQAYSSVSARLHLESFACALSSVYTFGPIFHADKSQPTKQLAEMWTVEVELAFAELEDVINCAEDFLKFLCQSILENCSDDMKFISSRIDKSCIDRLQSVMPSPCARISYSEAIDTLKKVTNRSFETKIEWGIGLSKEHESYLADEIYKLPVIIYNYPKEVKPFYVHIKEDGKTASAFDIIVPKAGLLVTGSQREDRIDMITSRIQELGLPQEQYEWYLDLRRHGTVKHSGFSLGMENMVVFATGLQDIRDAIPFPRTCGNAKA